MRIALGAVLVFAALWFVALKPKPVEEVAAAPTPAAESATPAAESSTPAQSSAATETPAPAAKPAETAKAEPKAEKQAETAKPETKAKTGADKVLADLDAGRTVVLLVWDGKSADDRSVRRAVSRVDRHDGKVRTHVVSLAKLSSYEAITKGVPITESPTVLVIDSQRQARVISGLTVKGEIDDAVDRALAVK